MHRVLKPGGKVAVLDFNNSSFEPVNQLQGFLLDNLARSRSPLARSLRGTILRAPFVASESFAERKVVRFCRSSPWRARTASPLSTSTSARRSPASRGDRSRRVCAAQELTLCCA